MPDTVLDNPALASLNYGQSDLGRISERAAIYHAEISPLAGITERTADALAELAQLVTPGTGVGVMATNDQALPESQAWHPVRVMHLRQMVCETPPLESEPFDELGLDDVDDMIALAELTEPGPFLPQTIQMGRYIGVHDNILVAMAGERMKPPGWIEISAVCTHPDARGHGYASRLVANLLADCFAQDQRAFLHVVAGSPSEHAAIAVYERAGFRHRKDMFAHVLVRTEVEP